jgi:hypothetical protein
MAARKSVARFAATALAVAFAAGCGDNDRAGRYQVTGSVTWNGTPVERGFVTFQPADGKPAEAGPIKDGRYTLYAYPGANSVSIRAEKVDGFNKGMNQPNIVQYIPPKYNVQTELSAEVALDDENEADFSLKSD